MFYILAAALHRHTGSIYLATAMGCAAVGLLLRSWGMPVEYYTLAFAIVGLLLLAGYRLAVVDRYGEALASAAFGCGNALLALSFVAAALLTLNHLAARNTERVLLLPLLLTLVCINLVTLILVRHQDWRRFLCCHHHCQRRAIGGGPGDGIAFGAKARNRFAGDRSHDAAGRAHRLVPRAGAPG